MDYRETAALLREQDQILIITHRRPDGDTVGCAAGLCTALRALGKTAWVLKNPDATSLFTPYLAGLVAPDDFTPDYVVSVDTAGVGLLTANAMPYHERGIDLVIDHHGSNEGFAKINCVDATRASCGELVYDIVRQWGPVGPESALPLYAAVATDTGCFVYSNTTSGTHRVAADLIDIGIDYRGVNKRHFRTKSMKRLQLEAMLSDGMELFDGGTVAVGSVTIAMMDAVDAREEDAEDISAFVGQVEGVRTAAKGKRRHVYIALNKPVGIVCTTESGVKDNIVEFVDHQQRIFPVGRLDKDSEGLILLTSNGDIVNRILRAENKLEKEYLVGVNNAVTDEFLRAMARGGVPVHGEATLPCKTGRLGRFGFRIILTQGLNRQIRLMAAHFGYRVKQLHRARIGNVKLGHLKPGQWRNLTDAELRGLLPEHADW